MAISTNPDDPNFGLETDESSPNFGLPVQQATQEPSGFVKGLQTAQQALGVAQDVYLGAMTGGGNYLSKLAFPEQHAWERTPIVSPETATGVVHTALTPLRTLEEVAFGEKGKQGAATAEQFIGEQLAGFTSPESLALVAAGGVVGKMPKIREIAFGKPPEAPLVQPGETGFYTRPTDTSRGITEGIEARTQSETVQPLTEETVRKVEEVIPNAEQIQGPARANVDVQLPGGAQAREGYGGEMPADVGGERVPPRGQGETLQQAPQEVIPTQEELFKVSDELAKQHDQILVDQGIEAADEFAKSHPLLQYGSADYRELMKIGKAPQEPALAAPVPQPEQPVIPEKLPQDITWDQIHQNAEYVRKGNTDHLVTVSPSTTKEGWSRINYWDQGGIVSHLEIPDARLESVLQKETYPRGAKIISVEGGIGGTYPSADYAGMGFYADATAAKGVKTFVGPADSVDWMKSRLESGGYKVSVRDVPEPPMPTSQIPKGGTEIPSVGKPKPTEVGPQVGRPEEGTAPTTAAPDWREGFTPKGDYPVSKSSIDRAFSEYPDKPEGWSQDRYDTFIKQRAGAIQDQVRREATPVSEPTETTTAQPLPKTEPPPPAAPPPVETAVAPEAPQKASKIGKSIEAKAVEAKLTEGFKDTALYDPISIADQAQRATSFVKENPELARAVVRGEAPLPEKLRGTSLITAIEEELLRKPDAKLAYELANSPLVSETSVAAQELRMAGERIPDSLSVKFQEIKDARKAGSKLRGETTESVFQEIRQEIVRQSSKRPTWEAFVKSIEC